jgi:hypothetical protein
MNSNVKEQRRGKNVGMLPHHLHNGELTTHKPGIVLSEGTTYKLSAESGVLQSFLHGGGEGNISSDERPEVAYSDCIPNF